MQKNYPKLATDYIGRADDRDECVSVPHLNNQFRGFFSSFEFFGHLGFFFSKFFC